MNWQWQRRIRHITRRITPIKLRGMRLRLLKDKIRERRGLPPKSIPMTVADARIDLMLGLPSLSVSDIDWLLLRHKLLARKRASRIAGCLILTFETYVIITRCLDRDFHGI